MTREEGTVSGDLDVTLDYSGHGLVRYRGTATWYTFVIVVDVEPRWWTWVLVVATAIVFFWGGRDATGNVTPFEA
ncbi:hypothetical protein ACFROC_30185 [Nocardia tengchongensis]|uniref:hypothetical protein n=1 Tax=Nocardia tengchongensis TaxID=2055889 RepID=UPI003682C2A1